MAGSQIVDTYLFAAASALAANTVCRYVCFRRVLDEVADEKRKR